MVRGGMAGHTGRIGRFWRFLPRSSTWLCKSNTAESLKLSLLKSRQICHKWLSVGAGHEGELTCMTAEQMHAQLTFAKGDVLSLMKH